MDIYIHSPILLHGVVLNLLNTGKFILLYLNIYYCVFFIHLLIVNIKADSGFRVVNTSTVGIATGYGLDDRGVGVRVPVG
jgi:hypothetical protein